MAKTTISKQQQLKPPKGRVLVSCSMDDKCVHEFRGDGGKLLKIYVAKDFNWDGKVSKMTQGYLMHDFGIAKKGDEVVFHHNAIDDHESNLCVGLKGLHPHHKIYSIDEEFIFFAVYNDKRGITPISHHALCERIQLEERSKIIIDDYQKRMSSSIVKIIKPPALDGLPYRKNQKVYILKYSDYEVNFSYKGKDTTVIRVDNDNIIAVDNG